MKKTILLLAGLLFGITTYTFAQDNFKIDGVILDNNNQEPVPYANVSIYNQSDSSLVKGTVTNDKGEFALNELKANTYYLQVSYVGYQNKLVDKIELSNANPKFNLGKISLNTKDTELGEVVIKFDKLKGQEKVDRTVYNITAKVQEVSTNGLDVLKHIPSVSVDFQENVTLEGRGDILFFVDDIKRDKDYVAQIDPSTIESVSTTTNPSSKYDQDVSGIIYITLKKEKRFGLSGRATAGIPSPPNIIMNPSASLDYGFSNFRIYLSDRMHYEKFTGYQESKTIKTTDNIIDKQIKNGDGDFSWNNNNLNYGLDWFIDDKNTLNFFGNYSYFQSKQDAYNFDNSHFINDDLTDRENILQNADERGYSNYFSLYYKRKFEDEGHELSIQGDFYDYLGKNENNYQHEQLDISTNEILNTYNRNEYVRNNRNSSKFQVDYSKNFTNSSLEIGSKTYYQWVNNKQLSAMDAAGAAFKYDETRQATYVNFTRKFNKTTMQAGLRTEFSKTNINEEADNEYFCWLPQLSLNRKFEGSQNLKLNISRKISRPGIGDLNPFEIWYDNSHVSRGNPNLKPAYTNRLALTYSKNFKSNMLSPKLFAKYITDDILRVSYINDNGITETNVDNVGESWVYGLGLTYALKLADWWRFTGYASIENRIFYSDDSFSELENSTIEKTSYKINANSIFTVFKNWNFMMMLNYQSPRISYQSTSSRDLLWIIGVEKEIIKNGKMQIFYLPPYTREFTFSKNETRTPELYNSWEGVIQADYLFAIEFTYTFSSGKKVKKLNRSTEMESDGNGGLF